MTSGRVPTIQAILRGFDTLTPFGYRRTPAGFSISDLCTWTIKKRGLLLEVNPPP